MLGLSEVTVSRLRREGLLIQLDGYPSYSRTDVQEFIDNPWLNGRQAALVVMSRQVVESADGCAVDGGVDPVVIVEVDPAR